MTTTTQLDPEPGRSCSAPPDPSPPTNDAPPLRSVHTSNFSAILQELGISVLVTTYQAGKLVMLRPDGDRLNTHFRGFSKPMGLAVDGDRLAIGTSVEIWEYHNAPAVARQAGAGRHATTPASCRARRSAPATSRFTRWPGPLPEWGSEQDSARPELWFVNTRFSCLCTRSNIHSFVPRWRPPFISALAPEDRCHLNGLCMVEGRPAFVTAPGHDRHARRLAEPTRKAAAFCWRWLPEKSSRAACRCRTRRAGTTAACGCWSPAAAASAGSIPRRENTRQLTVLPGFTRGLDFCGPLAFIGLSQVRESAVFSGIAIAERPLAERCCGVWVVNIHTGQTVAFVKFEDAVQEIFAVQVLPGVRHPDVINDQPRLIADSFVVPDEALDLVPAPLRHAARETKEPSIPRRCCDDFQAMAARSVRSRVQGSACLPPRQVPAAGKARLGLDGGTA